MVCRGSFILSAVAFALGIMLVSLQPRSAPANLNFLVDADSSGSLLWNQCLCGAVPRACSLMAPASLWPAGTLRQSPVHVRVVTV